MTRKAARPKTGSVRPKARVSKSSRKERGSIKPAAKLLFPKSKMHLGFMVLVLALVVTTGGYIITRLSLASSCTVSATLVNSCRPWIGAAVGGDPRASSSDKWQQFLYLEKITGRQLDVFHDYHPPGSDPLNADEISAIKRSNTYAYINWKPASNWSSADGGNSTVNANIKKAADNIKTVAPHKVFLTVWHEPQNDVSGGTTCKLSGKGNAGTPAQYRAMWQNVRNIFNSEGVNNVVWVINYQGYPAYDCMIPELYPGNNLVDWVAFETYAAGSQTMADRLAHAYGVLTNDTDSTHNFTSKPWAVGEFGDCGDTASNSASNYQGYKAAFDQNKFPRIKMAMVFDSANGPGGTSGCLVDNSSAELSAWKALANDAVFKSTTPSPTPTPTPTKTPTPTPTPTKTPTPTPTPTRTPTPTPTPSTSSVTLDTSSDTYVDSSNPSTNYGDATALRASNVNNRALLRFKTASAIPTGDTVKSVQLKIYVLSDKLSSGGVEVHPSDGNWTAATVTWNNQGAWSNTVLATSGVPSVGHWLTVNLPVSAFNRSGDTTLGLMYTLDNAGFTLASREYANYGNQGPQLVVTYTK